MKTKYLWWLIYPIAMLFAVLANKAKFGEFRFKDAHRAFAEGVQ